MCFESQNIVKTTRLDDESSRIWIYYTFLYILTAGINIWIKDLFRVIPNGWIWDEDNYLSVDFTVDNVRKWFWDFCKVRTAILVCYTECSKSLGIVIRLVKTDKQQYDNNIILMMWLSNLPYKCASAVLSIICYWYYTSRYIQLYKQ